jgi:hypothetical protein
VQADALLSDGDDSGNGDAEFYGLDTNVDVAVKVIDRDRLEGGDRYEPHRAENPLAEVAAMQFIDSRFVQHWEQAKAQGAGSATERMVELRSSVIRLLDTSHDADRMYMVLPCYKKGELFDHIGAMGPTQVS